MHITPDRWQSKTLLTIDERGIKIARNSNFDCDLSPVGIENSVFSYFRSTFVDRISGLIAAYPVSICDTFQNRTGWLFIHA